MGNTFHSEPTEHDNPYHHNPYNQKAPPPTRKSRWVYTVLLTSLAWMLIGFIAGIALYTQYNTLIRPKIITRVVYITKTNAIKMYIPVQGMPPYDVGMSSGNKFLFVKSFAEALRYNDANVIDEHIDSPAFRTSINSDPNKASFKEVCHHALTGSCSNNLDAFNNQLMLDTVEFEIDPYTSMTEKAPYPDLSSYQPVTDIPTEYIVGSYDNRVFSLPMQHYGTAVFSFSVCCGGSGSSYTLESIDLY